MEAYDVVVVGAGPAGSLAARAAAEGGATTLLLDHRPELGHPVQCGEFVPAARELVDLFGCPELIAEAFDIPSGTVLRETRWMSCVSPYGHRFRFPLSGYTVSRRAFDKALAYRAEGPGPSCGTRSASRTSAGTRSDWRGAPRFGPGRSWPPTGRSRRSDGRSGSSRNGRCSVWSPRPWTDPSPTRSTSTSATSRPGGYAWRFPRANDANVGLGVSRATPGRSLDVLLREFLASQGLGPARELTHWWVPVGPPPESLVRGHALFAGDAANLVMATNGGGIPTAMLSGWLAGRAAARHAREGRPLADYDLAWRSALFGPLERAARIERFGERLAGTDMLLALGMRYIGASGLDEMMRLRWPARLGRRS